MKLEQLRILCALVDNDMNMSHTAEILHISQPSISKHIKQLELELATPLLIRGSHRITGLTPAGVHIVDLARQVLDDVQQISDFSRKSAVSRTKRLTIMTTHLHASYVFPPLLAQFRERYPDVSISLNDGEPQDIYDAVSHANVDLGVTTIVPQNDWQVLPIPGYRIGRSLVFPAGHPIANLKTITVEDIAKYPLITYCETFAGSVAISSTFDRLGIQPNIAIRTMDTESIKNYVNLGLGIAVVHSVAIDQTATSGRKLKVADVTNLFGHATAYIVIRPTTRMPEHFWDFVELLSPAWDRQKIFTTIQGLQRKAQDVSGVV